MAITEPFRPAAGVTSRSWGAGGAAESNRGAFALSADEITQPLRPATNRLARIRTWTSEFGARCALQLHHVPIESGRPASNGRLRIGGPVLFLSELRPRRSLRQESNPHLGRTKGACLPLTLRRRRWRRSESNRHLPRCKRGARPVELHPRGADGWSRTTTARGDRVTAC